MKRILLIEDDGDLRAFLEAVLSNAGYDVGAVRTASAGKMYAKMNAFDLVVTDWKLPDGSGIEIADVATQKGRKAIVITGFAPRVSEEARQRHIILAKPFRPDELLTAVASLIG